MSKKWRCRRHCCHSIIAGTTTVAPARFVPHLRVANRLRRLCPLGTRFPTVPAGVIGAEPLTLVPQHFPANQLKGAQHRGRGQPEGLPQSEARHAMRRGGPQSAVCGQRRPTLVFSTGWGRCVSASPFFEPCFRNFPFLLSLGTSASYSR